MKSQKKNRMKQLRRGATLVEAAIVLPVFLLLVFGIIELGLAVARYNMLAEVARDGARMAIVHGADAPPEMAAWNSSSAAVISNTTPPCSVPGLERSHTGL